MTVNMLIFIKKNCKEIVFQSVVTFFLYLVYAINQEAYSAFTDTAQKFIPYKISFFANYMFAAYCINYVLLPKLLFKGKRFYFMGSVVVLIIAVILIDEFFLEQIYFPKTRGAYFPGILFSLVETLPIIILFVGCKFAWDFDTKKREVERLKLFVKESELQFLKSQLNPHFLFNNLNNLYAYALQESPKTPSIILELSAVLRYMLYDCKADYVALHKEIDHLKSFIALYELQIGSRGVIAVSFNNLSSGYSIAPLILMVFIENAFKHSTSSQSVDLKITVDMAVSKEGVLTFSCKNDYLDSSNTDNLAQGIGLENVQKRLNLLYPEKFNLEITDINNRFEVGLNMNLLKKQE
ncbi:putative two-component system sensor but no kinase domain [Polaribacter irgensii 23-P]|uniref:Putative two-component system sensor but no kinase domain n=2 Tax=Polaribacter TaxID=52959 RepID=A4C0K8_9FLAO|nr:putative two-component system sensor but no kinase domain [Polaribacter irgensii 23-P]